MSNNIAIEQLWEIEERRGQGGASPRLLLLPALACLTGHIAAVTTKNTFCIGLARVGQETQM
jgi:hypothetical protein